MSRRLIIGVTGASGVQLAWDCLTELRLHPDVETHLIMTQSAETTVSLESGHTVEEFRALADRFYAPDDISAGPASGTFESDGMLVVPCSMKTVAGIHSGYADNLLLRAADVTMKEQRPLVLCVRETPLSPIHLRNLYELSQITGVAIVPPMLSYYNRPQSVEEMERLIVAKLLKFFGISCDGFKGWREE